MGADTGPVAPTVTWTPAPFRGCGRHRSERRTSRPGVEGQFPRRSVPDEMGRNGNGRRGTALHSSLSGDPGGRCHRQWSKVSSTLSLERRSPLEAAAVAPMTGQLWRPVGVRTFLAITVLRFSESPHPPRSAEAAPPDTAGVRICCRGRCQSSSRATRTPTPAAWQGRSAWRRAGAWSTLRLVSRRPPEPPQAASGPSVCFGAPRSTGPPHCSL